MNNLVAGSLALRYSVSLAAAGLVDNIPVDEDLAERMKLLTLHGTAWKDSPWFPIEVHDNILGFAASSGNLLVFFHPSNEPISAGRTLVFHRLPSIYPGVLDIPEHEFSIDSPGLLIYAQYVIGYSYCHSCTLIV
jgi:hypothetical protein